VLLLVPKHCEVVGSENCCQRRNKCAHSGNHYFMLHFLAVHAETNAHTQGSTISCCISLLSTQKQMRTLRDPLLNVAFPCCQRRNKCAHSGNHYLMLHFIAVNAETNAHTQGSTIKCCISLLSTQKQMRTLRDPLLNVAFPCCQRRNKCAHSGNHY